MKKIALLTESELHNIVFESARYMLLTESTKDVRNRMMRVVPEETMKELLSTDKGYNDLIDDDHGNQIPLIVDLYNKIRVHQFSPFANSNFLPGLYRIAITELGWNTDEIDNDDIDLLVKMVYELLQSGEKLDWNLNNMSFFDLYKLYGMRIEDEKENEINSKEQNKNIVPKAQKGKNGYKIIRIDSFEEAKKYGDESFPGLRLCYTQYPTTFAGYGGLTTNSVYVCLRDGWKDIQPTPDKNAPFDEYGLSMIFVFVSLNGNIAYCNTRWNHEHSDEYDVDHILTKKDLCDILGIYNFYEYFKPLTSPIMTFTSKSNNAIKRLIRGEDPKDIFDHVSDCDEFSIVYMNGKENILIGNRLLTPNIWYDSVSRAKDVKGCYAVRKGRYSNWINLDSEKNPISKKWYGRISGFNEFGTASICLTSGRNRGGEKRYNWVSIENPEKLLSKENYYITTNFDSQGYAVIEIYDKGYNWVNIKDPEHIISNDFYSRIYEGSDNNNGIYRVELSDFNNSFNWVDVNNPSHLLSNVNYCNATRFNSKGIAAVCICNEGWNWVSIKDLTHTISKVNYNKVWNFNDNDIAVVRLNISRRGKTSNMNWVSINNPEKLLSNVDYTYVTNFNEYGVAIVSVNRYEFNLVSINNPEKLLCNRNYSEIFQFDGDGFANIIDYEGGEYTINIRDVNQLLDKNTLCPINKDTL